jgi:hypothetical protein
MNGDVFAVGSPYLCGNIFVIAVHGYGNIVLEISADGITKPEKEIINRYKDEDDLPEDCKPLFKKEIKELNISLKKVDYILLDERDEYFVYELTYRNLKAYIVENWNGYSAKWDYEVFQDKDEAVFWVFSK